MAEVLRLLVDRIDTPIGELTLAADGDRRLRAIDWTEHEARMILLLRQRYGNRFVMEPERDPGGLTAALAAYFEGNLGILDDLPVETAGTAFQRSVWSALRRIPCGTTESYSDLARRIGVPSALRAVGRANGANPVGIVVPCHRVVGKSGSLTGYAGGIERKRWLLAHEARS